MCRCGVRTKCTCPKKTAFKTRLKMAGEVSQSHAKSTGIVSIFILIFAAVNLITGFVFVSYGAKDATGIWIGLLVRVQKH